MIINRENLTSLYQTLSTAFQQGVSRPPVVDFSFMYTDFPSDTSENMYNWVDLIAGFRKWVGDRVWNDIQARKFLVPNVDFECSHSLGRNDLLDNRYGIAGTILQMKGAAWPVLLMDLVAAVLVDNQKAFTDKAVAAAGHAYGKNTFTNLTANALSVDSFEAALVAASGWKWSNGELIRPRFTHLLVGEKLRNTAFAIVKADKKMTIVTNKAGSENVGAGEEPNPNFGRCELVVVPQFAGDADDFWALVDCSGVIKPIARQIRETPTPKMDTEPFLVEKSGKVDFYATGRAAAAPTFPHLVYMGRL